MPLAEIQNGKIKYVQVIKTEEKGSDVNLATHLLNDAYLSKYEAAVVVSNDSDLVEPIRIVSQQLHKVVGVLNPHKHPSQELLKYAKFVKKIRSGVLRVSQFSDQLEDKIGIFHKPDKWR